MSMRDVREPRKQPSSSEHSRQHETDATVVAISDKKYLRISLTLNGEQRTTSAARFGRSNLQKSVKEPRDGRLWPRSTTATDRHTHFEMMTIIDSKNEHRASARTSAWRCKWKCTEARSNWSTLTVPWTRTTEIVNSTLRSQYEHEH